MRIALTIAAVPAALLLASCQSRGEAQAPVALFDGESLDGWRKVGGTGSYRVEDACIVGFGENIRGNTFLRTEREFGDFELRYEFRILDRRGNTGVMFRARQRPSANGNGRVYGYQCEGDQSHKRSWTAGLFDEARRGWLHPRKGNAPGRAETRAEFTAQGQRLFRWDDWNQVVIRCEGPRVRTWLNGELRVDYTETSEKHLDECSRGFLALQVHGGKSGHVRWRKIELLDLSGATAQK